METMMTTCLLGTYTLIISTINNCFMLCEKPQIIDIQSNNTDESIPDFDSISTGTTSESDKISDNENDDK